MERGYESSVRRTEARSESGRVSGLEICPPYPVTVHSVVRPANRHAFGNRTSWQSPGARPGPARCSRPNIGVGAQVNPGHGLASSRARGKSACASGQSGKYPKRALGLPLLRVVLWKTRSAPRVIRQISRSRPETSLLRVEREKSACVLRVSASFTRSIQVAELASGRA